MHRGFHIIHIARFPPVLLKVMRAHISVTKTGPFHPIAIHWYASKSPVMIIAYVGHCPANADQTPKTSIVLFTGSC